MSDVTALGVRLDPVFWDSRAQRWNTHAALGTTDHVHISHFGDKQCDIIVARCMDGNAFIEDSWGNEAPGYPEVFRSRDLFATVTLMSWDEAVLRAREIVAEVCGVPLDIVR